VGIRSVLLFKAVVSLLPILVQLVRGLAAFQMEEAHRKIFECKEEGLVLLGDLIIQHCELW
jgi:hypothetical protein